MWKKFIEKKLEKNIFSVLNFYCKKIEEKNPCICISCLDYDYNDRNDVRYFILHFLNGNFSQIKLTTKKYLEYYEESFCDSCCSFLSREIEKYWLQKIWNFLLWFKFQWTLKEAWSWYQYWKKTHKKKWISWKDLEYFFRRY